MNRETKEKILDAIVKRTAEALAAEGPGTTKHRNPRDRKIQDLLDQKRFGCHSDAVHELVSHLTGKKFNTSAKAHDFSRSLIAIVPLRNPNSHDYPLNTVSVFVGSISGGIKPDGRYGNNMDPAPSSSRFATPAEIRRDVTLAQLEAIEKKWVILT